MPKCNKSEKASIAGAEASVVARREAKFAKQALLDMYKKVVVEKSMLHIEALGKEAWKQPHFWVAGEPLCLRMLAMVASCHPKAEVSKGSASQDGPPDRDVVEDTPCPALARYPPWDPPWCDGPLVVRPLLATRVPTPPAVLP